MAELEVAREARGRAATAVLLLPPLLGCRLAHAWR